MYSVCILAAVQNGANLSSIYIPSSISILASSHKRVHESVCAKARLIWSTHSIVFGCVIKTINSWFTCGTVTMQPYYLIGWKRDAIYHPTRERERARDWEVFWHTWHYVYLNIHFPNVCRLLLSHVLYIFHATYIIHNFHDEIEGRTFGGLQLDWYAYAFGGDEKNMLSKNCRQMSNIFAISKYTLKNEDLLYDSERIQNCWYFLRLLYFSHLLFFVNLVVMLRWNIVCSASKDSFKTIEWTKYIYFCFQSEEIFILLNLSGAKHIPWASHLVVNFPFLFNAEKEKPIKTICWNKIRCWRKTKCTWKLFDNFLNRSDNETLLINE